MQRQSLPTRSSTQTSITRRRPSARHQCAFESQAHAAAGSNCNLHSTSNRKQQVRRALPPWHPSVAAWTVKGGSTHLVATGSAVADTVTMPASADAAGQSETESKHYEEVAEAYEQAFFYSSSEYRRWVMGHVEHYFGLPDEDARIVDLGGGTGNFWCEYPPSARRVLCVDYSAEMLARAAEQQPRVEPMKADALAFARLPPTEMRYSRVLLKELVHHIPPADVPEMYAGLYAQLEAGGCALTITRPQEVDYPLFARAREIWRQHQPHHSLFVDAMEAAGFQVEVVTHDYQASLPKATWLGMMRSRFWSTFSHCSDEELEQGIAEVDRRYAGQDSVQFVDRLLFLVARKPALASAPQAQANAVAAQQAQSQQQQRPSSLPFVLTAQQRQQYREQGFTGPVDALSADEASAALQAFQKYEAALGGAVSGDWRFKSHLLLPWLWQLARHPRIVGAVSEALGGCRNILCWSSDWFVKSPGDRAFASWHQDSLNVALRPPADVVTAWLAFTPSGLDNGCLRFLPGSHLELLPHEETQDPANMLLRGQTIRELEDKRVQGVHVDLQPGQMTLHNIQLAHCSGAAAAGSHRRVGIALRYMAAHVRQELDPRDSVTVVSGSDTFHLYRHERPPAAAMDPAALEHHRECVARVYPDGPTKIL